MASKIDHILEFFDRSSDQFFSKDEFKAKLKSGKKLRIKFGVDVTAPTIHIGHAVNLWLMRYLQDMGHKVIFLIGDFTTRIGDPTGRTEARPVISRADIDKNAELFIEQAKMVLRFDDPNLLEIRRNSEWFDKMSAQQMMEMLSMVTHARLLSRDMFQMRIAEGKDIHMHEIVYPVVQGWDSLELDSDLTIVGSDQLFNEMMGRFLQEKKGKKPQTIITTKITPGIDGKAKQSKSLGNYIGLGHSPRDKFGRVMSIPDDLIDSYFRVYTDVPLDEIDRMAADVENKPREAKIKLAYAIVGRYHGHDVAVEERNWFVDTFSKGKVPEDIPVLGVLNSRLHLIELLKQALPDKSKGDLRRLIKQGAIELNNEKQLDGDHAIVVKTNDILKVGKRSWFRIEVVQLNELSTERLLMKSLHVEEIDLIQKYIPEWEMAKYMGMMPTSKKMAAEIAKEVLKKVVAQPEPKNEWLWKVIQKKDDGKIIGLAHLRKDLKGVGQENIWIDKELHDQGLMGEVLEAVNEYAFLHLGISGVLFKDAFAHAAAPQELELLRQRFMSMDAAARNRDDPEGTWGFTKEGWERMKDQLWQLSPNINTMMTADRKQRSKKVSSQFAVKPKDVAPEVAPPAPIAPAAPAPMQPLSLQAAQFQAAQVQQPPTPPTPQAPPQPNKPKIRDPRLIEFLPPKPNPSGGKGS